MFKKGWKYWEEAKEGGDEGAGAASADAGTNGTTGEDDTTAGDKGSTGAKWPDAWRQELAGEDAKALKQLERYQSPKDIWNKARALEQRISSGELRSNLPKEATEEQVKAWRSENGIPDAPDKYEVIGNKDKVHEADKERIAGIMTELHGVNVNNAQAEKVVDLYYGIMDQLIEERQDKDKSFAQQSEDKLRAEWGTEYRQNMNLVNGLLSTAPQEVQDEIKTGRLGNGDPLMSSPAVLQWLTGMAREINPVTTLIPNKGGDVAGSIDSEIANIEKTMRTNRKEYNADTKMQDRYQQLLTAREKMKSKAA